MNFLFLVHRYPKGKDTILEKDFIRTLKENGHSINVVVPNEGDKTEFYTEDGIEILSVKTGTYAGNQSKIKKGISIFLRSYQLKKKIFKHLKNKKIDFVVGYTPFMANPTLIKKLKNYYNAKSILYLWDIFPQNAKDLKILNNELFFKFFKKKEKNMYDIFDRIICNCDGQVDYLLDQKYKSEENICIIRNSESRDKKEANSDINIRKKLGYKEDDIISIFGGNMGIPQELKNILYLAEKLKEDSRLKFILLGTGAQKKDITELKEKFDLKNLKIIEFLPREEYEQILSISDIGIISLNKRYTVPNFPAKVTGYVKQGIPIFASLDRCSIKYLGKFIEQNNIGVASLAGDIDNMKSKFLDLILYRDSYLKKNFEKVYLENFDLENAYKKFKKEVLEEENV